MGQTSLLWSGTVSRPAIAVPAGATDCHHHIYDSRYPADPLASLPHEDAGIEDYRVLASWLGITRHVIVQPSLYGIDNRCLMQALGAAGASARGVAVIDEAVPKQILAEMHMRGVRGVRINARLPGRVGLACLQELSRKIAEFGWHMQLAVSPDQLLEIAPLCRLLPCEIVFDHMAYLHTFGGTGHPAYGELVGLLQTAKAWVKLSGPYIGQAAASSAYEEAVTLAAALTRAAPDRLLWGTDWPHPTVQGAKPDDSAWLDRLAVIAPDDATRHRILVENPAKLYGFSDQP